MQILKVKEWLIKQREIKAQGNLFNIIDDRLKAQRDSIRKKWEEIGLLKDLIGLPKSENIAQLFESQARQIIEGLDIEPEPSTFKTKEQS